MRRKIILLFLVCVLGVLTACEDNQQTVSLDTKPAFAEQEESQGTIFVYVCGAVCQEGVYELPAGSRVYEAIEMAGGFLVNAATSEINQAERLEDAMKIYVPTVEEMAQLQLGGGGKVNINTASKEVLMTLPGIGESKAESIIQYRKENGSFKKAEDIMQISGIKESLYSKIKDLIKV